MNSAHQEENVLRYLIVVLSAVALAAPTALAATAPPAATDVPAPAAQAPAPPPAPPATAPSPSKASLESLTTQAAQTEKSLRGTTDPVERRRLTEELEKLHHQMGPFDAAGNRIHCQAMWHDAAIESLDAEIKQLKGRSGSAPGAAGALPGGPAVDLRLQTREMARACLVRGWGVLTPPRTRYQVDAFGEYLVNNGRLLNPLYDSVGAWSAKPAKLDAASEDRTFYQGAAEKVAQGVAKMGRAAEAMAAAPQEADAELIPPLADFLAGLRAVRETDQSVREYAAGRGKADAAPAAEPAETFEAEPPPMTDDEKQRLAHVRQAAANLQGEGWAPVVQDVQRFAAMVETGFQVTAARSKARQLMAEIERAANLAESIASSKCVYPEYLTLRQTELDAALKYVEGADTRALGYARIAEIRQEDQFRRDVEAADLAPAAARGLVYAYSTLMSELRTEGAPAALNQARHVRNNCRTLTGMFPKIRSGPPKDMSPRLKEMYLRGQSIARAEIDAAGACFPAKRDEGILKLAAAAARASDLDLLMRADAAVKAVAKYRPARASAMTVQILKVAPDLVARSVPPDAARQTLQGLVQPFDDLARFPLPEADLSRAVNALVGRSYQAALAVLGQDVGNSIDAASAGDPLPLKHSLEARWMFGILKRRAAVNTYRLDKIEVSNLVSFSIPEKAWATFTENLDTKLRTTFAQYVKEGPGRTIFWLAVLADWDLVYAPVAAGQRLSLDARTEGESELDLLLRNLEQTSVPPSRPYGWYPWVVGYHATEAAVAMNSGMDAVAAWHRFILRGYDGSLRAVDLAPAKP